ncbi:MAG: anthrone oxygenase family protein [Trebonia sp.]
MGAFVAVLLFTLLAHMWWLCGNAYEAVVLVPRMQRSWEGGSAPGLRVDPKWYYLSAIPAALGALGGATSLAWVNSYPARGCMLAAAVISAIALALTVFIIVAINLPLFYAEPPPPVGEGLYLTQRWRRLNLVRVVLLAAALGVMLRVVWGLIPHA